MAQQHTTATFVARGGMTLFYRRWTPEGDARGAVVIAHGLGEHSGRYAHVAQRLNAHGYDVWALDHRGHGRSGGGRGVIDQRDDLLHELHLFTEMVRAVHPHLPFLLGHSLGGLIAASYAVRRVGALRGVILSSAALKLRASGMQIALARALHRVAPAATGPNGLHLPGLSRDAAVVGAYTSDPHVHGRISARLGIWMHEESAYVLQNAGNVNVPILVMWAGQDRLVDPAGSAEFVQKLPAALCEARPYPGLYHELFNELPADREQVLGDLIEWLDRR